MKRVFVCLVVALMVALGPVGTGYALSDAEYREMVQTSDEFAAADMELAATWKYVYGQHKGQAKKDLLQEQRGWLKYGRDAAAKAYMNTGMSKANAYTRAVGDRIEELNEKLPGYRNMTPEEKLFASRAARDVYQEKLQASRRPKVKQICGVVERVVGLNAFVTLVRVQDIYGNSLGNFFASDAEPDPGYEECGRVATEGALMCFDFYDETPNDMGFDKLGINDPTMRWIKNCTMPD